MVMDVLDTIHREAQSQVDWGNRIGLHPMVQRFHRVPHRMMVSMFPRPPQELPAVPPMPPSFMAKEENDMKRFLNEYEPVETKSKVLRVEKQWEPNQEMTPHEARAFWLEKEVISLKKSLAKMSGGNPFQDSQYWSHGFQPPPPCPGHHPGQSLGGCGEVSLHDRAGTTGMDLGHQPGHSLGGCGVESLRDRASTSSMGQGHLQGHLRGGSGAAAPHDRAGALSSSRHGECQPPELPPQARALHETSSGALGLHDLGSGSFPALPRHGVGGGGLGEGLDRVYGPWTGQEGGFHEYKIGTAGPPFLFEPLAVWGLDSSFHPIDERHQWSRWMVVGMHSPRSQSLL